jgi:hypothetical protein
MIKTISTIFCIPIALIGGFIGFPGVVYYFLFRKNKTDNLLVILVFIAFQVAWISFVNSIFGGK